MASFATAGQFSPEARIIWDQFLVTNEQVTTASYTIVVDRRHDEEVAQRFEFKCLLDRISEKSRTKSRIPNRNWTTWIQTPNEYLIYNENSRLVTKKNGKFDSTKVASMSVDIWGAMFAGVEALDFGSKLSDLIPVIETYQVSITQSPSNLQSSEFVSLLFTPSSPDVPAITRITFDRSKGALPVEYVDAFGQSEDADWGSPVNFVKTSILEIREGIYVPQVIECENYAGPALTSTVYSVDWKMVNEEISRDAFTDEGLDLPDGVFVVNKTGSEPLLERVTGRADAPNAMKKKDGTTLVRTPSRYLELIVYTNLFLIVTVIVVIGWRKYVKSKT